MAPLEPECSTSSPQKAVNSEEVIRKARELLAGGKTDYACGNYQASVEKLSEACKLFDETYLPGQTSLRITEPSTSSNKSRVGNIECADAYIAYGASLAAIAKSSNDLFDASQNARKNGDKSNDKDSGDKLVNDSGEPNPKVPKVDDNVDDDEEEEGRENEYDDTEEDIGQNPDGNLAIECLESAKLILLEQDTKECDLKAADCLINLAELVCEINEDFTGGLSNLVEALKIKSKHLDASSDREIAEIHFIIGSTLECCGAMQKSSDAYKECGKIMAKAKDMLVEKLETDKDNVKIKNEIEELDSLCAEVSLKREDLSLALVDGDGPLKQVREMFSHDNDRTEKASPEGEVVHTIAARRKVAKTASETSPTNKKENMEPPTVVSPKSDAKDAQTNGGAPQIPSTTDP